MTFTTQIFEPTNIMRYVSVYSKDGMTNIIVDWNSIYSILELNKIPLHPQLFKNACVSAIDTHICKTFVVPRNKKNATKTMAYMVALIIFEVAKIMLKEDSQPSVDGDIGDSTVSSEKQVKSEEIKKDGGKLIINRLG